RAIIEIVAMYDRAATHILAAGQLNDQQTIYDILTEAMYSNARKDAPAEAVAPPRIGEVLDQFETRNPKAKSFYDQISDLVHPNGHSALQWLSINEHGEFHFTKATTPERERFIPIYNALISVCYWMTTSVHDLRDFARTQDKIKINIS